MSARYTVLLRHDPRGWEWRSKGRDETIAVASARPFNGYYATEGIAKSAAKRSLTRTVGGKTKSEDYEFIYLDPVEVVDEPTQVPTEPAPAVAPPHKRNRFQIALDVQDAVNMRAVARAFTRAIDEAAAENRSTETVWADPAVRLFVNKFESLSQSTDNFAAAYAECVKRAAEQVDQNILAIDEWRRELALSLMTYVSGDDVDLDRKTFLRFVSDRIAADLPVDE